MDISPESLRRFVAVAELRSFTRAARDLFISQPALTRDIARLESELGVRLFERTTRHVELTDAGRDALVTARRVLARWERATYELRHAGSAVSTIHLCFDPAFRASSLFAAVRAYRREHPAVRVGLRSRPWEGGLADLLEGIADLAVFGGDPDVGRGDIRVDAFGAVSFGVAMSVEHRLAGRRRVSIADVAAEPWLLMTAAVPNWRTRSLVEARLGRPMDVVATFDHSDDLMAAIAAGIGVIVAPMDLADRHRAEGVVIVPFPAAEPLPIWLGSRQEVAPEIDALRTALLGD